MPVNEKKAAYAAKVASVLSKYTQGFLVFADNVGSAQMAKIRIALREMDGTILFGKNTLVKRCIQLYIEESGDTKWNCLPDLMVGNVGILFVEGDLSKVRDLIDEYRVPAAARVGLVAPLAVTVPAGNTGMDPSQTSFFQALNINTKITKGTVEIINDVKVIEVGQRVGGSQAVLLQKLGIKPFEYGLEIRKIIQNGAVFDKAVLDLTDEDIARFFGAGLNNVTALALGMGYPILPVVPVSVILGFKNVLAMVVGNDAEDAYSFPQADKVKDIMAKIASGEFVPAAGGGGGGGGGGGSAAAAPAPEPEPEEEEEEDMGFDLFD